MEISTSFVVVLLLLFITTVAPPFTDAEITDIAITADSRPLILLARFAYSPRGGSVAVSVTHAAFASPNPSLLSFLLLPRTHLLQSILLQSQNATCIASSPYVRPLFTLRDVVLPARHAFSVDSPDDYSLFFANCNDETAPVSVSMSLRIDMHNVDPSGSPDYLSVGESPVPTVYLITSLLYLPFLSAWLYSVTTRTARPIHRIMAGLLLAKAMSLLFAAEDRHYVRTTGTPHGWDVLFLLFQSIKAVLLATVIVLIGTGWSILKPFLHAREKNVLVSVIPLQVVANVATLFVVTDTAWRHVFLAVDFVCCFLVLSPVVWSIRSLRETAKFDGKAARSLAKLLVFRRFYVSVVVYLYFTRVAALAIRTVVSYEYRWVSVAVEEAVGFAFYAFVFYMFRPKERNEYFVLDDIDEEAAMVRLREEGFEL